MLSVCSSSCPDGNSLRIQIVLVVWSVIVIVLASDQGIILPIRSSWSRPHQWWRRRHSAWPPLCIDKPYAAGPWQHDL